MKAKLCLSILTLSGVVLSANIAHSQTYQPSNRTPVADNTLGTQVSGSNSNFNVTGGLSRGQNLFHSFTDFSVPTNGSVTFTNPVGNQSIITRVTGNLYSDINGKIDTNGANLFLINPNGIIFGNNAQLNVGKAFIGSTANGINLVDAQGRIYTFGTKNINDTPLLTVNPNVFLNVSSLNMGASSPSDVGIRNYGLLQTGNDSQYIGLIGGNVTLDGRDGGGKIIAPGGRVDLGGLNLFGTASINDLGLVYTGNQLIRSDVSLINGAVVDVRANQILGTINTFSNNTSAGSTININANNLQILNDLSTTNTAPSSLKAGLNQNSGIKVVSGGDINLNTTGKSNLNYGNIINIIKPGAQGTIGNINITTRELTLSNDSLIASSTEGKGNAGNINIKTIGDILVAGNDLLAPIGSQTTYKGSFISSSTFGEGNAGRISIDTQGKLSLLNTGIISSETSPQAIGNSQGISISAQNLELRNGSSINASTSGKGTAGNIIIKTTGDITVVGYENFDPLQNRTIYTGSKISSNTLSEGAAGQVSIEAQGKISLLNEGKIASQVSGKGNSQGINVSARELDIRNSSSVRSDTFSQGNAGNINIKTTGDITVVGYETPNLRGIQTTNDLLSISTATFGSGNSGKISIDTPGKLSLLNQGYISSEVAGSAGGNSQGVSISVRELNLNTQSYIFSRSRGNGNAGNIDIKTTDALNIGDNSLILSSTLYNTPGREQAGNISIASDRVNINNGGIAAESDSLKGGNITLTVRDRLLMQPNSDISNNSSSTQKNGDGGNITIDSPLIIATPGNNNISANASAGSGGRVNITSQGLFGIQFRPKGQDSPITNDITASSTFGQNGTVNINTPGIDPGKDANQLPTVPTDASNQISQTCSPSNRDSKFAVTGRGGLPKNAYDLLTSDVIWQDSRAVNQPIASNTGNQPTKKLSPPAIGWVFDGKGKVTLIAAESQGQPTGTRVVCPNGGGK
jgi:filamentous hemagglutinin family protein